MILARFFRNRARRRLHQKSRIRPMFRASLFARLLLVNHLIAVNENVAKVPRRRAF